MNIIARIQTEFAEKFGIPRQSGLAETLGIIVFEPEFRSIDAVRGLDGFSHIWLIWEFSEAKRETWSPTVRPPRLGGNERMGVFATRSPFRPNALGLSCVELVRIEREGDGAPKLIVRGADLMHGTPIFDIKPYVPYADCRPQATGGFAAQAPRALAVEISEDMEARVPPQQRKALREVLAQDPRPSYQTDETRVYGMTFANLEVRFRVAEDTVLVEEIQNQ